MFQAQNNLFRKTIHSMASLLSTQGTSLFVWIPGGWHHAIGTTSTHLESKEKKEENGHEVETLLVVSGVFLFFFGGKEKIIRLKMQKLRGSFSKFLRDPFLAFGYVLVFQIIQPLGGFWMLVWSTNLLSYLSAHTKDCQGQKSQSDEGHKSWRNHNLLGDGVMSRG